MKSMIPLGITTMLLCAQVLQADQTITTPPFNLSITANVNVDESNCKNSPGPTITVSGTISLASVTARLNFANNAKGTHEVTVLSTFDVAILPPNTVITIPKQPVRGGVGGNPHISLQFTDAGGNPEGDEIYLGRCVQGLSVSQGLPQEVIAKVNVHADSCSNHKGPFITLDGSLFVSGLNAKIIFRNNLKGTHTAEDAVTVTLIGDGTAIVLPKQPVRGGVGGNPIISIEFLDGDGSITGPIVLGRCVQL